MEQIAIFCDIDDFCKDYEKYCTHSLLMDKNEVVPNRNHPELVEQQRIRTYCRFLAKRGYTVTTPEGTVMAE